jgi:hypothetical protein
VLDTMPVSAKLAKTNDAILRKIWPILAEIFFQPFRPPSRVRYHACLSSYAKLAKTDDAILRKWPKNTFWTQF